MEPQCVRVASLMTLAKAEFFLILVTGCSNVSGFRGSLNAECAVRPPSKSVAAMPEDATAKAI